MVVNRHVVCFHALTKFRGNLPLSCRFLNYDVFAIILLFPYLMFNMTQADFNVMVWHVSATQQFLINSHTRTSKNSYALASCFDYLLIRWHKLTQHISTNSPLIVSTSCLQFEWDPKIVNEPLRRPTSFMCIEYHRQACYRPKPKILTGNKLFFIDKKSLYDRITSMPIEILRNYTLFHIRNKEN